MSYRLRPDRLVETGLSWPPSRAGRDAGEPSPCVADAAQSPGLLEAEDEMSVYRIVQEALAQCRSARRRPSRSGYPADSATADRPDHRRRRRFRPERRPSGLGLGLGRHGGARYRPALGPVHRSRRRTGDSVYRSRRRCVRTGRARHSRADRTRRSRRDESAAMIRADRRRRSGSIRSFPTTGRRYPRDGRCPMDPADGDDRPIDATARPRRRSSTITISSARACGWS